MWPWPLLLALLMLLAVGCTQVEQSQWTGPRTLAPVRVTPWDAGHPQSRIIKTPHYEIYTDLSEQDSLDNLAQLMEGAYEQYQQFCPGIPLSSQPLRCYLFAKRDEWATFTQRHTGEDAAVYLQITRGAYTVDDWFVAFWLGDRGTFSVAAHEGFHQFAARQFQGRIAPVLDEGLACMCENIGWEANLPRWNLSESRKRSEDLAAGLASHQMWSLKELLRMHAGDVISLPRERIDTFYAQSWALARFLWEGDGLRHRPALQRYLAEVAAGRAHRPAQFANLKRHDWNPDLSIAQLEYYLGSSLTDLEPAYEAFCRRIARRSDD
jgi:hypothetical protein